MVWLFQSLKHESNDVKQLVSQVVTFVAKSSAEPLDWAVIKNLVPMLVMGTKEKNTAVRSYSESALVALLKLRDGNDLLQVSIIPWLPYHSYKLQIDHYCTVC